MNVNYSAAGLGKFIFAEYYILVIRKRLPKKPVKLYCMKKFTFCSIVAAMLIVAAVRAQETVNVYQIPNSNLNEWEKTANGKGDEPLSWHSFMTASGTFASFASNQLSRTDSVCPGGEGFAAKIWAKNIVGKIANGNFTTGTINMGSMDPGDANNYNFTDPDDSTRCCPFHGRPDSVKIWLKFMPIKEEDQGQVSVWIHDRYKFKDPHSTKDEIKAHAVAQALLQPAKTNGWQEFTIPFDYSVGDCEDPQFILVSVTTNKTPGGGTGAKDKSIFSKETPGDTLYIDDIRMVYNSRLDTIYLDGVPFDDFNKESYFYDNLLKTDDRIPEVTCKADGKGAVCHIDTDELNSQVTITVSAQDESASHVYQLNFVSSPNAVFDATRQSVKVFAQQGCIYISGNDAGQSVEIYNMQGQLIDTYPGNEPVVTPQRLIPGTLYIVKVGESRTKILF